MAAKITGMQRYVLAQARDAADGLCPWYPVNSPRHLDVEALVAAGYLERTLLDDRPRITEAGKLKSKERRHWRPAASFRR